ncbi:MAG TPA: DUF1877 family protein [Burkholderiaceae bacterium]|nr:DUF1877 family protein [Burkholderiaceae bacterium]
MSVIAYFLHVDDAQLQAVREQPAVVWNLGSDPRFATARLVDVDKDYEVLAWLLSPRKRLEQAHQLARYKAIERESESKSKWDKTQFMGAVEEELVKLGVSPDDPDKLPTDPVLEALEGRGPRAQRDPRINFGLGSAMVFKPDQVKSLSSALSGLGATNLRLSFERGTLSKFDVGGMDWQGEQDDVLDRFLAPAFYKIRSFYMEASSLGHHVLVIYQ